VASSKIQRWISYGLTFAPTPLTDESETEQHPRQTVGRERYQTRPNGFLYRLFEKPNKMIAKRSLRLHVVSFMRYREPVGSPERPAQGRRLALQASLAHI
jgi:hypothetical protein